MSNFELQEKAVKAATRFIERKGYELLETGWTSPEGTQIDLVANDEDTLVFIDVTATEYGGELVQLHAGVLSQLQRPKAALRHARGLRQLGLGHPQFSAPVLYGVAYLQRVNPGHPPIPGELFFRIILRL